MQASELGTHGVLPKGTAGLVRAVDILGELLLRSLDLVLRFPPGRPLT